MLLDVTCTALATLNRCFCRLPIWRATRSDKVENNWLLFDVCCTNAIDKNKEPQFSEHNREICTTHFMNVFKQASHFYKEDQTPCKLLLVRRPNAQWTFSEFLFGLSFKWKFATQWCAEVHQNGILDWINPRVVDRQKKYPLILCERLMSEPITGGWAFSDLQMIPAMLSGELVIPCLALISPCSAPVYSLSLLLFSI